MRCTSFEKFNDITKNKIILLSEFSTFSFMNIFTISLFSNWSSKGWSLMDVSFFFTEWSYLGSFCEKFDNLVWKKLLMAFCLGILCKNVHLFNVFSLILFIQIVSILRAQSSIINNTEESNPITTSKSCYICLRGVIKWEY